MITLDQAKTLQRGTILYHVTHRNVDGTPQRWRVTGKPLTWKRMPNKVEIPLMYGLYSHDRLTEYDLHLVCLKEEEAKNG